MNPHRGINTASITGEGLEGLPGLLMTIGFVFLFLSLFMPRGLDWFLGVFLLVAVGASALYLWAAWRNRNDAEKAVQALHHIND